MSMSPYAVALLPSSARALYVAALASVPAEPVNQASVAAALSPIQPAPLLYDAEPEEVVPAALVQVTGSVQWTYPKGQEGPLTVVAMAVVYGSPPLLVIGWVALDAPLTLSGPDMVALADVEIVVAKQPG